MDNLQPVRPVINHAPETATMPPTVPKKLGRAKKLLLIGVVILLVAAIAAFGGWWFAKRSSKTSPTASDSVASTNNSTSSSAADTAEGLQLDPAKNYGHKYADGILPVGDNQYTTTAAEKGKVYLCHANFVPSSQAGAQTRGPWFIGTTKWDINKKYSVSGSVSWDHQMTNAVSGATRTITSNDLPNHVTGVFPVKSTDNAYQYDRNPNSIKSQSLTYALNAQPTYGKPRCMGGEVGVMLTGSALFNGFDAGGRDAGAWEIQDACEGHPQGSGIYHYHTLSACIKDVNVDTVIGFALDGFPITGPKVGDNNYLTTDDLDECHGIVSDVTLDGQKTTTYHYVMTQDFPYSASCFRSDAIESPGQHAAGQQSAPPDQH